MALAKTAAKQPAKEAVQASIAFQAPAKPAATKAPAKKAIRQPRVEAFVGEPMAVKEWVQNTDFLRLGIDLYSGRLIAYGTYAQIVEIYEEQSLYEKLCLNVGEADDPDTYMRLHEGILRMMALKLGVVNAAIRPRDELAVACALDIRENGWLPALDADLALDLESLRLQPNPPSSMLSLPERKTESSPAQPQGDAPMALAKKTETPAKPAKAAKAAPAGKPAASPKPAPAAKAADKPASPKPAAVKAATPKAATPAKPAAKAAAAPKAPRAEAVEQNGIKAPLDMTGKCGRVWVACDKKLKELKGKATFTSADIVASLPEENEGNVRLETSRWAKFHGHALPRAPRAAKAE